MGKIWTVTPDQNRKGCLALFSLPVSRTGGERTKCQAAFSISTQLYCTTRRCLEIRPATAPVGIVGNPVRIISITISAELGTYRRTIRIQKSAYPIGLYRHINNVGTLAKPYSKICI